MAVAHLFRGFATALLRFYNQLTLAIKHYQGAGVAVYSLLGSENTP